MKNKILRRAILLFYILPLIASVGCVADQYGHPLPPSATPVAFELSEKYPDIRIEQDTALENFSDSSRWLEQLKNAASLLPEETMRAVTTEAGLLIKFRSKPDKWYTGWYLYRDNSIVINTAPNPDHPFLYEYFSENGYTDEEMLYVWLHELGHAWDLNSARNSKKIYLDVAEEGSPTLYGYRDTGLVNKMESFAETFVLYVVMPQYLHDNFPMHYAQFKDEVFDGAEYNIPFNPPSSIVARLSK